jgi:hypothetical protein
LARWRKKITGQSTIVRELHPPGEYRQHLAVSFVLSKTNKKGEALCDATPLRLTTLRGKRLDPDSGDSIENCITLI